MIGDPKIVYREERLSMGIRTIASFRDMFPRAECCGRFTGSHC
jgi:hypothetical protein